MNKTSLKSVSALGFIALLVPAIVTSCSKSDLENAKNATSALCCNDFKVGADMSGANFGMEGSAAASFRAVAQASADLSATASLALSDVTGACKERAGKQFYVTKDARCFMKAELSKDWAACNFASSIFEDFRMVGDSVDASRRSTCQAAIAGAASASANASGGPP
jgi:hypothetical protein